MTKPRKCAIIGTGAIAGAHAKAIWANEPATSLVAVADIELSRAETFARKHKAAEWYSDVTTLLGRSKPDLVHICTPPGTHASLCIAALDAGADVLCEKPLCASLRELDLIREAEARAGRTCASVFQLRFGSGTAHLRNLIQCGVLGSPLVGVCNTLWFRDATYYDIPWRGKWHTELGGPTMGHGIHSMDQLLSILGPWQEIQATANTLDREIEVEDVSMATVRFQCGTLVSVVNSVLSPRQETYLRLDCQRATVELTHLYEYENADWKFTPAPGFDHLSQQWNSNKWNHPSDHCSQLRAFLNDLNTGVPHSTSGDGAAQTLEFLTALYKSAFEQRRVSAGEITKDDPFYRSLNGGYKAFPGTHARRQALLSQTAA